MKNKPNVCSCKCPSTETEACIDSVKDTETFTESQIKNKFNNVYQKTLKEAITPENEALVKQLQDYLSKGATFASFYYKSNKPPKGSGGEGIYNVRLGVSYSNYVKEDLNKLQSYEPKNEIEAQAKEEMIKSMDEHVTQGVSSAYTQQGLYTPLGKGISINNNTGDISIRGYIQNYQSIVKGVPKKEPVKPITIAKENIKKTLDFKHTKIRVFKLTPESVAGVKMKGDVIEFQNN
jgi:hypothetical protein